MNFLNPIANDVIRSVIPGYDGMGQWPPEEAKMPQPRSQPQPDFRESWDRAAVGIYPTPSKWDGPSRQQPQEHDLDAVDTEYIAGIICPEEFKVRVPKTIPLKTALFAGSQDVELIVNISGNGAVFVFPRNPIAPAGGGFDSAFVSQLYDPTFNPKTGKQTV